MRAARTWESRCACGRRITSQTSSYVGDIHIPPRRTPEVLWPLPLLLLVVVLLLKEQAVCHWTRRQLSASP
jgi:hypothetical protein